MPQRRPLLSLLVAGISLLAPLSLHAEAPATQPSTTQPSTQPSAASNFPTPAELLAKLKGKQDDKAAKIQVAFFDFDQPVVEQRPGFSLFGGGGLILRDLLDEIRDVSQDPDIRAVLITLTPGMSMNSAQAMEIRGALEAARKAGKRTFVYADTYDTSTYLIASAATDVCLLEGGDLMMQGVAIEPMFYRGAMDKLGVKPDYVQIGEYKGAEEPYTRTEPSPELAGELTKLVDSIYNLMVDRISLGRGISKTEVQRAIDETFMSAAAARDRGFVDHLVDQDGLRELLESELGDEINIDDRLVSDDEGELDMSNPFAIFAEMAKKPERSSKPLVAIITAEGVITDGGGGGGLFSEAGVGSVPIREAFRKARRDDQIKAVVLRIDSPGGSALASEVMWQAIRRCAEEKPVIVSVGGMAASGGYYMASAGEYIYADPSAIVGSIGVVGGKFVLSGLYEKVGLTTTTFSKGRNADLFSPTKEWDERQKRLVRNWMKNTYDQFTSRIMATRSDKISDIDKVARGRIFLAEDAVKLGMVDEIGGLHDALAYAARDAGLKDGEWDVLDLPEPRGLADILAGGASMQSGPNGGAVQFQIKSDSILHALPAPMRTAVMEQIQLMQLFENRPVVLVSPYRVDIR